MKDRTKITTEFTPQEINLIEKLKPLTDEEKVRICLYRIREAEGELEHSEGHREELRRFLKNATDELESCKREIEELRSSRKCEKCGQLRASTHICASDYLGLQDNVKKLERQLTVANSAYTGLNACWHRAEKALMKIFDLGSDKGARAIARKYFEETK